MNIKIQRNFKITLMKGLIVLILGMVGKVSWGQTTVTYNLDNTTYFTKFASGGDIFTGSPAAIGELGMWANSGSKQVAAWRTYKTAGDNSGSNRTLRVGDVFKITVSCTRAFGQIGFSLNAAGTQGTSYANNISGSRLYVNTDNNGSWYVNRSGGNTSFSYTPSQNTYRDYIFTIRITSSSTADVFLTVSGTDYRAYNLALNGSGNIDAFSVYGSDMWDGNSNDDAFWKQTCTVENTGRVELGYFLASGTYTPGTIADGLEANSTTTNSVNNVFVGGDAGSIVALSSANTYTGTTTVNANGTLRLGASSTASTSGPLGTTAGGTTVSSGGVLDMNGNSLTSSATESLTINGTGISSGGALINSNTTTGSTSAGTVALGSASNVGGAGNLTLSGVVSGGFAFTKTGTGSLTLTATNTYTGVTTISAGTMFVNGSTESGSAVTVASVATLGGNGTVSGTVALNGKTAPGSAPSTVGQLSTGALTIGTSTTYTFDITNVSGSAGTNWDYINTSGAITINATSGSPMAINLTGNPTGFSDVTSYSWKIATGTSVSGFAANKFTVNTTSFTPSFTGIFSISNTANDIFLNYTPVPIITAVSSSLPSSSSTQTYKGATITVTGTTLGSVTTVKLGGSAGTIITGATIGASSISFVVPDETSGGTVFVSDGTNSYTSSGSLSNLGFITTSGGNGNWSSTGNWLGASVPNSSSAIVTIANSLTLDQDATVSSLTINSGTFTASDNTPRTLTITKSATGNSTTLANSGTWANGVGGSTVTFTGAPSSGDAIHGVTGTIAFQNIIINKTGGSSNVGVNFGTSGTSLASGGKLTIGTGGFVSTNIPTNFYTVNGSTTLEFSQTGGTYNVNAAPADITWPSSNSPANINITTGTVNLNTTRTASGNLNITGGSLVLGANLTINGDWTRASSANFTPSTYTVTLSGSSAQTIQITGGGAASMYGLVINNAAGVSLASGGNATSLTVSNALTLTSGALTTNGNTLTLNAGIAITRGTGTISTVPTFGGTSSVTYTTGGVTTDNELNSSVTNLTCSNASGTVTLKSGASLTATAASNVSGGTFLVPTTSTLILGGGFTNAGSLTIEGNLQLNAGSFILNSSNVTYGSTGNLIYNTGGSYGMSNEWPASSGPNSITIQNSGTNLTIGSSRTISATGSMTVNAGCSFTVSSGLTLTTNNNLTLKSDATGTASIGNSAGSFSGEVTVERYIPANGRRYRFLASPVVGGTTLQWRNNATNVSGRGIQITGSGTVDASTSNLPSAFSYLESNTTGTINDPAKWTAIDGSTTLTNGVGYRVFVRGDRSIDLTTVNLTNNATTIWVKGTYPSGTRSLPVTYTSSGGNGWNLVGNPYPSSINWNAGAWVKTNINDQIAIYRPSTNSYSYYTTTGGVILNDGSNIIGSGQAFWVRATATPTLTCTEAVKVTSAPPTVLLKTTPSNQLRLKLTQDSSNIDETVIAFGENFSDDFIETEDVNKLTNVTVNISSVVGIEQYAAINFTSNNYKEKTIPLSVWGNANGNYQLDLTQVEGFDPTVTLFLKDKFLNTTTTIDQNKSINFSISDDSLSKGDFRFELLFKNTNTNVNEISSSLFKTNLNVYPNPASDILNINLSNANFKNSNIVVYGVSGMEVLKTNMPTNNTQLNIETLSNGVYFVKVSNENGFSKTVKFVK